MCERGMLDDGARRDGRVTALWSDAEVQHKNTCRTLEGARCSTVSQVDPMFGDAGTLKATANRTNIERVTNNAKQ